MNTKNKVPPKKSLNWQWLTFLTICMKLNLSSLQQLILICKVFYTVILLGLSQLQPGKYANNWAASVKCTIHQGFFYKILIT